MQRILALMLPAAMICSLPANHVAAQETIEAGERIRVGLQNVMSVQPYVGSFVSVSQDSISLILENDRLFIAPLSEVRYVATSKGRSRITLAQSAAVGAGVAGAVTALAMFTRTRLDSATDASEERPWLAIGMAGGSLPGALVGLAVGAFLGRERWRRLPDSTYRSLSPQDTQEVRPNQPRFGD